jgi:hypothetical protein
MAQQANVAGDILRVTHSSQGAKTTAATDVKKGLQQS